MEEEQYPPIGHFYVAFCVFNFRLFSCRFVCEVVMTHRYRFVAKNINGVVFKADFSPWLESESFVFRVFWVSCDKVGESAL